MGVIREQLATLLYKDVILRRRSPFETICLCLCPALSIFLACLAFLFIEDKPYIVPFTTEEAAAQTPIGASSTFLFDPYPLDCVALDAISLLARADIGETRRGGGPIQEKTIGLQYTTNFDCFLNAISNYIPLWNIMVRQLRERPSWLPKPTTFGVVDVNAGGAAGGGATSSSSLGAQYKTYMESRYDQNIALVLVFYNLTDTCFRNENLHYALKNIDPDAIAPSFGGGEDGGPSVVTSPFAALYSNSTSSSSRRALAVGKEGRGRTNGEKVLAEAEEQNFLEREAMMNFNAKLNSADRGASAYPSSAAAAPASPHNYVAEASWLQPGTTGGASTVSLEHLRGHQSNFPVSSVYEDCITNRPMECFNACFFQDAAFRTKAIAEIQGAMGMLTSTSSGDGGSSRRTTTEEMVAEIEKLYATNIKERDEEVARMKREKTTETQGRVVRSANTKSLDEASGRSDVDLIRYDDVASCLDRYSFVGRRVLLGGDETFDMEDSFGFLDDQREYLRVFNPFKAREETDDEVVEPSSRRSLQGGGTSSTKVDCRTLTSPCDCAAHRESHGCQWRQRSRTRHGTGVCRAGNSRTSDTSCSECASQAGCSAVALWGRLGQALPRLSPYVREFADEEAMTKFIGNVNYPSDTLLQDRMNRITGVPEDVVVTESICAAVVFDGGKVTIRPNATSSAGVWYGLDTYRSVSLSAKPGSLQAYQLSGFLGTQAIVNDFLQSRSGGAGGVVGSVLGNAAGSSSTTPSFVSQNVSLVSFGRPKHQRNAVLEFSSENLWSNLWIAFCFPVLVVAGKILREKETKIRDGMRMMGLRDAAFYLEDFVFNAFLSVPIALVSAVTLYNMPDMVIYSNVGLLFLLFFLCQWHTLSFAVFLTSFFSTSLFGKIVCFGLVNMSRLFLELMDGGWKAGEIRALGLFFPPVALCYEMRTWTNLEIKTDGLTSDTITWKEDRFSVADGMAMHCLGIFLYSTLFVYFDQVIPTDFGIPRPWYFPVSAAFWRETYDSMFDREKSFFRAPAKNQEVERLTAEQDPRCFEKKTEQQRDAEQGGDCVQVKHLRKEFHVDGSTIVAVDDFSTTMYKNEIYILLGHNGAGKTTTFSMLTGLIPVTKGTSDFFGSTMEHHLSHNRAKVGICPQFSVLWPQLTPLEHLVLFAMFKGVSQKDAYREAEELLREQGMQAKRDALARTLSGGMRRKLSLAIAFTGNPELVFLDEPSSGLDSSARHDVWNLLRTRKDNRIIILTTHYMDEADALGDRIAIMSHGRIKCCGSPNFLKNVYGCGYNLSFTLTASSAGAMKNSGANLYAFLQEVLKPFPVKLLSVAGRDVLLLVPFEASSRFEKAFERVEVYQEALQIKSWNLYVCNLEEVFLKIASDEEILRGGRGGGSSVGLHNTAGAAGEAAASLKAIEMSVSDDVRQQQHQADKALQGVIEAAEKIPSRSNSKEAIEQIVRGELDATKASMAAVAKALEVEGGSSGEENGSGSGAGSGSGNAGVNTGSSTTAASTAQEGGSTLLVGGGSASADVVTRGQSSSSGASASGGEGGEFGTVVLAGDASHDAAVELAEMHPPGGSAGGAAAVDDVTASRLPGKIDTTPAGKTSLLETETEKHKAKPNGISPEVVGMPVPPAESSDTQANSVRLRKYHTAAWPRQMRALLWKRYLNSRRDWITTLVQQTCPVLLVSLSLIFIMISLRDMPYRDLTYESNFNEELESKPDRLVIPVGFTSDAVGAEYATASSAFVPSTEKSKGPLPLWPDGEACPTDGGNCRELSSALSTGSLLSAVDGSVAQTENTQFSISGSTCPASTRSTYNGVLDFVFSAFQQQTDPLSGLGGFGGAAVTADRAIVSNSTAAAGTSTTPENLLLYSTASGSFSTSSMAMSRLPTEEQRNSSRRFVYSLENEIKYRDPDTAAYGAILFAEHKNVLLHVNHTGYHAAPIMLQYFYNYLAAQYTDPATGQAHLRPKTKLAIHPLPQTADEKDFRLRFQSFSIAFNVMISFAFVSCFSLVFVVSEKESEIKAQQFINGVDIPTYWMAQYVFDFGTFLFPIASLLLVLPLLEVWSLVGAETLPVFIALLLLFALAIPSFFYLCAHGFRTATSAMTTALVMNLLVATVLFIVTFVFEIMPFALTRQVGQWISFVARVWPVFTFGEGIRRMALVSFIWTVNPPSSMSDSYYADCERKYENYEIGGHWCAQSMWDEYAAGTAIKVLAVQAVLYISIAIAIDLLQESVRFRQRFFEPEFNPTVNKTAEVRMLRDADVVAEERRVHQMSELNAAANSNSGGDGSNHVPDSVSIFFKNVSKLFKVSSKSGFSGNKAGATGGREMMGVVEFKDTSLTGFCGWFCCYFCRRRNRIIRDVHAVRDCSFALQKGDVFGLLGANGAGKTTTFRMMCGVTVPAKDPDTDIRILGQNIFTQRAECRQLIGYTAQANPLWMGMTVKEHLEFYAMMKGIPPAEFEHVVQKQMEDLDLLSYVDKRATNLSGGNKRKLVIAMSLIGAPPVLFLDEPSAGMDPAARRKMWSILHTIATKRKHSTVILTSHSMDEVEALCSKLCIMTNGIFRCMGSLSRVKELYGRGFDLYAKFEEVSEKKIREVVRREKLFEEMGGAFEEFFQEGGGSLENAANSRGNKKNAASKGSISFTEAHEVLQRYVNREMRRIQGELQQTAASTSTPPAPPPLESTASNSNEQEQQQQQHQLPPIAMLVLMLRQKNSPFPQASRMWNKQDRTFDDESRILSDTVRLMAFGEWFLFALWRLKFSEFVARHFPEATMLEQRQNVLLFRIEADTRTNGERNFLGPLFGLLEQNKEEFHIMEYAVTPTTLEQIFNQFTYAQIGEDDTF
eukprot:CAMPEP_0178983870 /NCGR_PEP_ID=MMETSP0795-20121207/1298_1 /TAXON_ID=88552 /ORGANISM="Amoebophrya sp., Strain Ameob2" /LENGTH=2833 /DNA_ID=CAMNT_0020674687 /DNA_START=350 /DNA_END=8852 /DNA_ORIENTATION=+